MPNKLLKVAFFFCPSILGCYFGAYTFGCTTGSGGLGIVFIIGFFTCGCCAGNTFGFTGFVSYAFHAS